MRTNGARTREVRALALEAAGKARSEGGTLACVARTFGITPRTLRRWQGEERAGRRAPRRAGRRAKRPPLATRRGLLAALLVLGLGTGVNVLRALFHDVPYRQIAGMKRRLLRVRRRLEARGRSRLEWHRARTTWAMDFTEPEAHLPPGQRRMLVVRDLASGMRLASVLAPGERASVAVRTLRTLFRMYGPPLVLKHDQGSAFTSGAMQHLLETWKVTALASPAYTPRYNGSQERSLGWTKQATAHRADVEGHAGRWTQGTADRTRRLLNATSRPWGALGPTPEQAFHRAGRITAAARRAFQETWAAEFRTRLMTHVRRSGSLPTCARRRVMERKAIQAALVKHGYLTIRRGCNSTRFFYREADGIA